MSDKKKVGDNVRLFVCGDVILFDDGKEEIASDDLKDIIRGADYSICNFEGALSRDAEPENKIGPPVKLADKSVKILKDIGFDMFLLASNHIADYGEKGIKNSIEESRKFGIDTIGAGTSFDEAYKPIIKEINGIRIGMVNACEAHFGALDYDAEEEGSGYAWINHVEIDRIVKELRERSDFVIFFAHAGLEHAPVPLREWRHRYRQLVDMGVDVVVGAHPHVPQGYEFYHGKPIFYSLGNFFMNNRRFTMKENRSYSVILDLDRTGKIDFDLVYYQIDDFFVKLSTEESRIDMEELNGYLGDGYRKRYDDLCMKVYNKHLLYHYFRSYCVLLYRGSIKDSLKFHYTSIVQLFSKRKRPEKYLLRLHLIRNESYRYASQRALYLMGMKGRRYP